MQPNSINVGVVMARSGTIFPDDAVGAPEQLYSPGWGLIHNVTGQDLDRDLRKAGWSFFFMAGSIQASVLGRRSERSTRNAMRRVLAKANRSSFNCLEVTELSTRTIFGIPYTHITAHSRHAQSTSYLEQAAGRKRIHAAWAVK